MVKSSKRYCITSSVKQQSTSGKVSQLQPHGNWPELLDICTRDQIGMILGLLLIVQKDGSELEGETEELVFRNSAKENFVKILTDVVPSLLWSCRHGDHCVGSEDCQPMVRNWEANRQRKV